PDGFGILAAVPSGKFKSLGGMKAAFPAPLSEFALLRMFAHANRVWRCFEQELYSHRSSSGVRSLRLPLDNPQEMDGASGGATAGDRGRLSISRMNAGMRRYLSGLAGCLAFASSAVAVAPSGTACCPGEVSRALSGLGSPSGGFAAKGTFWIFSVDVCLCPPPPSLSWPFLLLLACLPPGFSPPLPVWSMAGVKVCGM